MITEGLFEKILLSPVKDSADILYIVSGFASATMAYRHLSAISSRIDINLIIGMTSTDGIGKANHLAFQKLASQSSMGNFNCRYLIEPPPIHSKVYAWHRGKKPFRGYLGSANYTQYGFIGNQRECMSEMNAVDGTKYYRSIHKQSIDCMDENVESQIKIYDERYLPKRKKIRFERERTTGRDAELRGILTDLPKRTLSWLANDGSLPEKSGLNWGQRPEYNREPNQAYIPIPSEVYRTDYFPEKGERFLIFTDDHDSLVCVRAQANGKAIHTPENNSLLGVYFRRRLSVRLGAPVSKDDLLRYGRTDIDFYKIDDETYFLDFSV